VLDLLKGMAFRVGATVGWSWRGAVRRTRGSGEGRRDMV
jgi:hypothetical protein